MPRPPFSVLSLFAPEFGPGGGSGGAPTDGKAADPRSKFQTIGGGMSSGEAIESKWKRPLHADGSGATHVRTFTGKLSAAGLEYMDKFINEWLDNHPSAEVKFATMTQGQFSTPLGKEDTLIVQVWI